MKIVEVRHPLVQHKIGLMRDASLSTKDFRELANELGGLLAYEATADLDTEAHTMAGWLARSRCSASPGPRSPWCRSCAPAWACSVACSR